MVLHAAHEPPKAFITGVSGQDGSYLAESLLADGWQVVGLIRRSTNPAWPPNLAAILDLARDVRRRLHLIQGDMTDFAHLESILADEKPDYIFNLAAQSYVGASWALLGETWAVNATAAIRLMDAARRICPSSRFYQASTSELFGQAQPPQNEDTPIRPVSPYGAAKAAAHHFAHVVRISYGYHISCGILFNHESPRRGHDFVSRRIVRQVLQVARGEKDKIVLGDLTPKRDWGWAPDYVRAMRQIVDQDAPSDFVIATGEAHSVSDFLDLAARYAGVEWRQRYAADPKLQRRVEVTDLRGDATKARTVLNWRPSADFGWLVKMMLEAEQAVLNDRRPL